MNELICNSIKTSNNKTEIAMRKIMFLAAFIPMMLAAQKPNEVIVKSDIKKIKLFLTSAEITHQNNVKLQKGRNRLIYTGISAFANPQSIQFLSAAPYRLISFSTEMDFLAAEQFNPRIVRLKDSLMLIMDEMQLNTDIRSSYEAELAVLNTNRDLKGANANLTVAQIKDAADFYRTRTLEVNKQISKLNKESTRLYEREELIRYQLTELNFNENQRSNQVIILLEVDQAMSMDCVLNYLVSDCGWAATYDLSAQDINQKINLKYKAKIYNNTGNDWNNVTLTLSTADPNLSASQPLLKPWYLDLTNVAGKRKSAYVAPQAIQQDYRAIAENDLNMANQRAWDNYMIDGKQEMNKQTFRSSNEQMRGDLMRNKTAGVVIEDIEVSELAAEFEIKDPFSCPTDAKPYVVEIKDLTLDATFSYVTVPKLDHGAFLLANIVGWQALDLMPGPTNVYFGGQYVGVSHIDTRNVSDTLALSFGRDSKVTVMRKLKSEMSSKKLVGSSMRETYMYEIAVRNNRNVSIKIQVFDQIPVSRNTEITLSGEDYEGGKKDAETGEVTWEISLQPGEVKNLQLGYTVKYPKDAQIILQKNRVTKAPRYL